MYINNTTFKLLIRCLHAVAEWANKYIVNLNTTMCNFGRFQQYEIPCDHVIAVLRYRKLHEADFCSTFYSLKNFRDAYAIPIEPITCESTWDIASYISEPKMMSLGPKRSTGRSKFECWKGFADVKFKRTKSPAVDVIKLDIIERHVQIIMCKNNDFLLSHLFLCYFEC